jgi:hypothetical protein
MACAASTIPQTGDRGTKLMSATTDTLISVLFGALLGFGSSIAYSMWQSASQAKTFKKGLKDELQYIRKLISDRIQKNQLMAEYYHTDYFLHNGANLVLSMNAETYHKVLNAYSAIESLRVSQTGVQSRIHYDEVIESIDSALSGL